MKDFADLIRDIRKRNLREWLACLIIVPTFFYMGAIKTTILGKLLCFEIAFSALFISFYIYLRSHKRLNISIDLINERNNIINNEIDLLSTVRYWYVLPLFIGLTGITIEGLYLNYLERASLFGGLIYLITIIGLGAFIIYQNEKKGVQELKRQRAI